MNKIIKYKKEYIDQVVDLFLDVFENDPWNDNWPSKEKAKQYLLDIIKIPGFIGYLSFKEDVLAGVLLGHIVKWWQGDEYFIKEFFVNPHYQGVGIGSEMIEHLQAALKKADINSVVLLTENNAPAAEFYDKKGFKVSTHTRFMYKNID